MKAMLMPDGYITGVYGKKDIKRVDRKELNKIKPYVSSLKNWYLNRRMLLDDFYAIPDLRWAFTASKLCFNGTGKPENGLLIMKNTKVTMSADDRGGEYVYHHFGRCIDNDTHYTIYLFGVSIVTLFHEMAHIVGSKENRPDDLEDAHDEGFYRNMARIYDEFIQRISNGSSGLEEEEQE